MEHADEREKYKKLTERERDALRYVAGGFSAPQIREKLFERSLDAAVPVCCREVKDFQTTCWSRLR